MPRSPQKTNQKQRYDPCSQERRSQARHEPVTIEGITVLFKRFNKNIQLPRRQHAGDAAYDLHIPYGITLKPGEKIKVKLGFAIGIPFGFCGKIYNRSSLAWKGLTVLGGIIDYGYTGELVLAVRNVDAIETICLKEGERAAQIAFERVNEANFDEVDELPDSSRGKGGFGSTGRTDLRRSSRMENKDRRSA